MPRVDNSKFNQSGLACILLIKKLSAGIHQTQVEHHESTKYPSFGIPAANRDRPSGNLRLDLYWQHEQWEWNSYH